MSFTTYYLTLGERTHRLIQRLAAHEVDPLDEDIGLLIVKHARHVLRERPVAKGRPGVRAGMYAAALAYCRDFMPRRGFGWDLIGAEVTVGSCRADLAWRLPGAQIVFDELKVGASELTAFRSSDQVQRLLTEARRALGVNVLGVRVIHLGGAARSEIVFSDTHRRSLAVPDRTPYGPFN